MDLRYLAPLAVVDAAAEAGSTAAAHSDAALHVAFDGGSYHGVVLEGLRHGAGTLQLGSLTLKGHFVRGVAEGEALVADAASGAVYEGGLQRGARNGTGTFVTGDGAVYRGEWERSLRHGKVSLSLLGSRGCAQRPHTRARTPRSQGTLAFASNDAYDGPAASSTGNGSARCQAAGAGAEYQGDWSDDRRHGFGRMTYAASPSAPSHDDDARPPPPPPLSGATQYVGGWERDRKTGLGAAAWPAANTAFVGTWLDDEPHGLGVQCWWRRRRGGAPHADDGACPTARYAGAFFQGDRHGVGVMELADGGRFVGEWRFNVRCGAGAVVAADGSVMCGVFANDKRVAPQPSDNRDDGVGHVRDKAAPRPLPPFSVDAAVFVAELQCDPPADAAEVVRCVEHVLLRWNAPLRAWYAAYAARGADGSMAVETSSLRRLLAASSPDDLRRHYWERLGTGATPHPPGQPLLTLGGLWRLMETCGLTRACCMAEAAAELQRIRARAVACVADSLQRLAAAGEGGVSDAAVTAIIAAELRRHALQAEDATRADTPVLFREFVEILSLLACREAQRVRSSCSTAGGDRPSAPVTEGAELPPPPPSPPAHTTTTTSARHSTMAARTPTGLHKSEAYVTEWAVAVDSSSAVRDRWGPAQPAGPGVTAGKLAAWTIDRLLRCFVAPHVHGVGDDGLEQRATPAASR